MNNYNNEFITRRNYLQSLKAKVLTSFKDKPEGLLRASMCHGVKQFYLRKNKADKTGTYIKVKDRNIAVALAQRDFNAQLLNEIDIELAALENYIGIVSAHPCERAITKKKNIEELIQKPCLTNREFIEHWLSSEYERLPFDNSSQFYYSNRDDKMRSKSEVLIANMLYDSGIPFLYEKPFRTKNGRILHPDFTLLNLKTRQEIIWEHLGLMSDSDYQMNASMKIRQYEASGYFIGHGLIITFETTNTPFNNRDINQLISQLKDDLGYTNP